MLFEIFDFASMIPGGKEVATLVVFLALSIIFSIAVKIIFTILSFFAQKTKTTMDDEILKKLSRFFYYFSIVTALYFAIVINYGAVKIADVALVDIYIMLALILSAVYINQIVDVLLIWYANEISPERKTSVKDVFPFVRNIVKTLIYVAFVIIILGRLGIEIAPLVAGLGIAGLAVALALQDTLSNFFAGVHILADKPFREGNVIQLENGMKGRVAAIGWRTTRITTGERIDIIIPNAKLSQNIILNYHTPDKTMELSAEIGVDYNEDVNSVEKIILNALREIQKRNPSVLKTIEPWARFEKFGDYALIFKYGYVVTSFEERNNVLNEVNKELFYAFKKNNVEIPFPVRTIYSADMQRRK